MLNFRKLTSHLLLAFLFLSVGCVTSKQSVDRPQDFTNTQSIFWEVTKGQERHFLMGTIHVGVNLRDLPQAALAHLGSSERFIGELSSFEIDPQIMKKYTFLPENQKLSDLIGRPYVEKFVQILDKKSFPYQPELIERLSLYSVYSTLVVISSQDEQAEQADPSDRTAEAQGNRDEDSTVHPLVQQIDQSNLPIDLKLAALASNQGIQIVGFETLEDQLKMFQHFCTADKIQALIQSQDEAQELIQSLTAAYQTSSRSEHRTAQEQHDPFADLMVEMLKAMNFQDRQILLYNRNKQWIRVFGQLTGGKNSFIAVGAGHIPGEQGLVALLRRQGYQVQPAFFSPDHSNTADLIKK